MNTYYSEAQARMAKAELELSETLCAARRGEDVADRLEAADREYRLAQEALLDSMSHPQPAVEIEGWDVLATTDGGEIIVDMDDYVLRKRALEAWKLSNMHDLEALRAEGRRRGMVTA